MFTILTFLFFTGLVAFLSWYLTRNDDHESATGYFLAGRSLTWVVIGGSLLLTNLSTEQLVGLNGGGFQHGMQLIAWEVLAAFAMVVMALVFLPRYLKGGVTTVPEFLEQRYDRTVRIVISLLLLLSIVTNMLPFVLYSGAVFMREVFDVSSLVGDNQTAALWLLVVSIGVVGSIYAIFGGLKAVAVSDTLNAVGLFSGGLMIPILALYQLGQGSITAGLGELSSFSPHLLDPVGPEDGNVPLSTLATGMICINVYYWCTNQAIVQRAFGAKSLKEGQKGVLFASSLKLLGPLYLVLPGIIAFHMFGTVAYNGERMPIHSVDEEKSVVVIQLPKSELELDSKAEVDPTAKASDEKFTNVEIPVEDASKYVGVTSKDKSYGRLVMATMPNWMIGFFCAVIFGAVLSSFNSGLNSATTLFSLDIFPALWGEAKDVTLVRAGKIFGIIIAILAITAAPLIDGVGGGLFDTMKKLAALFNIPLLAITITAIFSNRVTATGAKAAIACGVLFYGYFGLYLNNHVFGVEMHWLHVAGLNFAVNVVVLVFVSLLGTAPFNPEPKPVEGLDVAPWTYAYLVSGLITVGILATYLTLHWIATR
ncbi:MAG: SSS family solute:Na+ symporter [Pirellulaceae bacterium]